MSMNPDIALQPYGLSCPRRPLNACYRFASSCFLSSMGISLVSLATGIPAASKAATFSFAVPLPLEMMAPACPICLPLGASLPEMKAATGLVTLVRAITAMKRSIT